MKVAYDHNTVWLSSESEIEIKTIKSIYNETLTPVCFYTGDQGRVILQLHRSTQKKPLKGSRRP